MDSYPVYELNAGLCIHIIEPGIVFENGSRRLPVRCRKPWLYPNSSKARCAEHYATLKNPTWRK